MTEQLLGEERARGRMLASQFDVFKSFAPLVAGRVLGTFARGLARVPETGLAMLHKDETVLPDFAGPFRQTARAMVGGSSAPPQVTLIVDGNIAPLMGRVRAEIDGRAARVVSEQLGRRSRLIAAAGGR